MPSRPQPFDQPYWDFHVRTISERVSRQNPACDLRPQKCDRSSQFKRICSRTHPHCRPVTRRRRTTTPDVSRSSRQAPESPTSRRLRWPGIAPRPTSRSRRAAPAADRLPNRLDRRTARDRSRHSSARMKPSKTDVQDVNSRRDPQSVQHAPSLNGHDTAVYEQFVACDKAALAGRQEQHRPGNFLRSTESPKRNHLL